MNIHILTQDVNAPINYILPTKGWIQWTDRRYVHYLLACRSNQYLYYKIYFRVVHLEDLPGAWNYSIMDFTVVADCE